MLTSHVPAATTQVNALKVLSRIRGAKVENAGEWQGGNDGPPLSWKRPTHSGRSKYLFHLASLRKFIYKLIKIPAFFCQWCFNVFNTIAAYHAFN